MKKNTAICLVFVLLAGCSGSDQKNEFLGNWVDAKNAHHTMTIEKNGENFILREQSPNLFSQNTMVNTNMPASLKNGMLVVEANGMTLSMSVDKSTGHLVSAAGEMVRDK